VEAMLIGFGDTSGIKSYKWMSDCDYLVDGISRRSSQNKQSKSRCIEGLTGCFARCEQQNSHIHRRHPDGRELRRGRNASQDCARGRAKIAHCGVINLSCDCKITLKECLNDRNQTSETGKRQCETTMGESRTAQISGQGRCRERLECSQARHMSSVAHC
jgi:hypothetical protein